MALATLTSTGTVTGISVESAKEAELPADGNHRAARFGVQDRTTTVFVYVVFVKECKYKDEDYTYKAKHAFSLSVVSMTIDPCF